LLCTNIGFVGVTKKNMPYPVKDMVYYCEK